MTGRDLIVYILQNNLEDEPVFKDGKFIGFMNVVEAAEKLNVGVATILALMNQGSIEGMVIGNEIYIPANVKLSLKGGSDA